MAKRKKKAAEKKEEDVFFVGIQDPIELRRSVLESSKDLLHYLSRFERFKNIRNEKAEHIARLKDVTSEIRTMVNKLRIALPKTNLRVKLQEAHKIAVKKPAKEKQVKLTEKKPAPAKEAPAKPKHMTDLEKLEAELGEIESRLTKI